LGNTGLSAAKDDSMQIPDELIEKWKTLRSTGDDEAIGKKLKRSAASISTAVWRAFREKKCGDQLFKALRDFYAKKESDLLPAKTQSHEPNL
jgi:hypothetical protein